MADKRITIRIAARDTASRVLKGVQANAERLRAAVRKIALALGIAGAAFVAFGRKALQAFAVQQEAETALRAALEATGKVGAAAFDAIAKSAANLQKQTTHADEAIIEATGSLTLLATRLGADELVRAQRAIVGIADTFLKGDVNNAAQLLGKTLGSTTNALTRYGIQVDVNASQSEKLNQVLAQTANMFEVSKARADTLNGRITQLKNAWGDFLEVVGQSGSALQGFVEGVTRFVQKLTDAAQTNLGETVKATFGYLGAKAGEGFLRGFAGFIRGVKEAIPEIAALMDLLNPGRISITAAAFDKLGRIAGDSAQYWTGRLNELALAAKEAANETAQLGGAVPAAVGGTGGDIRAPLPRGGLQPTIGGPPIPLLEGVQGALPTQLETRHEWRPVLELDTETVRQETLDPLQRAFDDVFSDFGKYVGELGVGVASDLIDGFINGTLELGDVLKRFLIGFAARFILGPLQSALGIFSPSRVTYGFGQNIVAGLIGGMDSMTTQLGAATGRISDTITAGIRPVGLGGLGGVVAGDGVQVTAQVQGKDESTFDALFQKYLSDNMVTLKFQGASF